VELATLLTQRRSTRRFDPDREVAPNLLERVLQAPVAMPHGGNTYDWRGVVLHRHTRDPEQWAAVWEATFHQTYVDEAPVVVVWSVQPQWWSQRYRSNVEELVQRGLLDWSRAGDLLELVDNTEADQGAGLAGALIGEAMMGVAAAMLTALDAGLGATVTACRPEAMAAALGVPDDAVVCPFGVLALGYPLEPPAGSAPKPSVSDLYFDGRWGIPLGRDGE
jgi:nitroreductase